MAPPANQEQAPAWYLEVNGKRVGPYTTDQLREYLQKDQIKPFHQVTAAHLNGQWISVQELMTSLDASPAERKNAPFQPPPRPSDLDQTPLPVTRDEADPAMSLFTALQASKERKQSAPMVKLENTSSGSFMPEVPPQLWLAILAIVALGAVATAAFKFFETSQKNESQVASVPKKPATTSASAPLPTVTVTSTPTIVSGQPFGTTRPIPVAPAPIIAQPAHNPPPPVFHRRDEREDERERRAAEERERERDREDRREDRREDPRDEQRDDRDDLRGDMHNNSAPSRNNNDAQHEGLEPAPGPQPVQPITIDRSGGVQQ